MKNNKSVTSHTFGPLLQTATPSRTPSSMMYFMDGPFVTTQRR